MFVNQGLSDWSDQSVCLTSQTARNITSITDSDKSTACQTDNCLHIVDHIHMESSASDHDKSLQAPMSTSTGTAGGGFKHE